jgi:UDP-2-acetamido-2,6-beta-L-arabino-hexul-4-ose reductase
MIWPIPIEVYDDARGRLFELIKTTAGQAFVCITKPGCVRGNHYHTRKLERFFVVQGEAEISVRSIYNDRAVTVRVTGSNPEFVDIPLLHAHNIKNVGKSDLILLVWASEIFSPEDPDTFSEIV